MRALAFSLAAVASVVIASAAHPGDLTGGWRGVWVRSGDPLPVTMTFAKAGGVYSGAFSSDALQVANIPLSAISDLGGKVHFEAKGDEGASVFDGTLAGETLTGSFTDHGRTGRFRFARARLPSFRFGKRDITFTDGGVTLSGTVLAPTSSGRRPAVLFLQGSGPEGRWANRYLAEKFAETGILALIYDKRGVADSTGDWRTAGFDALADDAAAGVRFLRTQLNVEPKRVGIYGHSQGGTIAPLVDAKAGGLAFIIASAAGGVPPADVETYSVGNLMGLQTLHEPERADAERYLKAVIDVAYRGRDRQQLDALAAVYNKRGWYFDAPPPGDAYWSVSKQIAGFRPSEAWARVKAPVLLIYGGHDERVPPHDSIATIRLALAGGGDKLTVVTYPNADHTFTVVDPEPKGGWPKHEVGYAATLIKWIKQLN